MTDHELPDDDLLDALADALRAPDRQPAPDRIADLRRQAEARGLLAAEVAPVPVVPPATLPADDAHASGSGPGVGRAGGDEVRGRRARRQAEAAGRRTSRRALLRGGAAAGIGAVVGAAGVFALTADDEPDEGPPTQMVAFAAAPEGVAVTGRTIDHTWGMELLLDVAGLPAGAEYEIRYATGSGDVAAGGFVAVDGPMHCRFNGTARRAAVSAVEVVDTATGTSILRGTIA